MRNSHMSNNMYFQEGERLTETHGRMDSIGASQMDQVSKDVLEQRLEEYRDPKTHQIDVRKCITFGLAGALCGTILGMLIFSESSEAVSKAFWGLLLGGAGGYGLGALYLHLESQRNDKYKLAAEEKRRQMRRMEQENIEKHQEYVYYDAGIQQGFLYRLLCCPHFGKITSERVIYSEDVALLPGVEGFFTQLYHYVVHFWHKKVESMDYDMVLDVSVEQSCTQFLTDTGTVVLHCEGLLDVSMIKDERERLIRSIDSKDEESLKSAITSSGNISQLAPLLEKAREVLNSVVEDRRSECLKNGVEFKALIAVDRGLTNTSKVVHIRDVCRPYQVLDDLSYKITKQHQLNTRDTHIRSSGSRVSAVNMDIIDRDSQV